MIWDTYTETSWKLFTANFKSENTASQYKKTLMDYLHFTKKYFWQTTAEDASSYYKYLTKLIDNGTYKGSTVYKKVKILSRYCEFLISQQDRPEFPYVVQNYFRPFLCFLKSYEKTYLTNALSLDEVDKLLYAARKDLLAYAIISLIFRTALRPADIIHLRYGDFFSDTSGTYLSIKRNNKDQIIYIPDDEVLILNKYMEAYSVDPHPETPFFANRHGKPMKIRTLQLLLNEYARLAGIHRATPYQVHNTSGSLMLETGASEEAVSKQLGITLQGITRYKNRIAPSELQNCAMKQIKISLP